MWASLALLIWLLGGCNLPDRPADAKASLDAAGSYADTDAVQASADATAGASDTGAVWQPKEPIVSELDPAEGPTYGMNQVTLRGFDLGGALEVRFGESPGLDLQVMDDQTLTVTAPPRPAGVVDVTVIAANRPELTLKKAYKYYAELTVTAVQPAEGPSSGGSQITVTGSGFDAKTRFFFGEAQAIQTVVVDETTAMMLAPAHAPGPVHVSALGSDGQGVLKKAYVYREAPKLMQVTPATAAIGEAIQVQLQGSGLFSAGGVVQWRQGKNALAAQVTGSGAAGQQLTVAAPTMAEPGAWDVVYTSKDGSAQLKGAFHYVHPQQGAELLGVSPNELPANALMAVAVAVSGPISPSLAQAAVVRFGGQPVKVLQALPGPVGKGWGATFVVVPPPLPSGSPALPTSVDVEVEMGTATLQKAKAFSYLLPQPAVIAVSPTQLPLAGGGLIRVDLTGTQGHGSPVLLRIGALAVAQMKALAPTSSAAELAVQGLAPPGSPGPADVVVRFADGAQAKLAGAVQYTPGDVQLAGLLPGKGAQAGGTWVTLVGAGLSKIKALWLGGAAVTTWKVQHDGAVILRTPPGKPGPAELLAELQNGEFRNREKAFVYFDPISADNGTWGEAIDGAVNVTVLKKGKIGPVPGALVMIGSDPQTALQGLTNAAGQITLSAPGLAGPLNVHASKAGWSAASVVAVNVENVTVRLQEFPPASPGNGSGAGGDEAPLPSYISGTVVDADKYTVFPMGSCKGQPSVASQCAPCSSDLDCLAGTACSDVRPPLVNGALTAAVPPDTSQKFCLLPCTSGQDCLPGFECRATGPDLSALQFRCTPRIGTPQVRCEGASQSIFGYPPASPGDGMADNQGKFTVRVNPGDTAILCKSGYIDKTTGEFVALAMGLTRRFFSIPGQSQSGAVVHVNVPLDRSLRVRMDRIPLGVAATGLRQMTAGLSLGAEGYLPTGQMQTYAQTDTLVLENQPSAALWGGENSDLRYELYGGLSQAYGASPNTTSQATHIDPRGLDRMAWLPPGSKQAVPSGAPLGPMACLASAGELRVAVGDRGAILHWTGGLFTPQPSPTAVDLTAVWLAPDGKGDGWIGAAGGVLLRKTKLGWQPWPQMAPRTVVAMAGRTADDAWLVDDQSQLMHWNGSVWSTAPGPWPVANPPKNKWDPVAPPKQVRSIWQSPEGTLWLVGDQGALVRGTQAAALPGEATPVGLAFEHLAAPTWLTLRSVWGTSDDNLWIAGDRGFLARWDGSKIKVLPTGVTQPLWAVRGGAAGEPVDAVGGQGTWLRIHANGEIQDLSAAEMRVDLRGWLETFDGGRVAVGHPVLVIGPYLEYPNLLTPAPGQSVSGPGGAFKVSWTAQPGLDPTLNIVRVADYAYQTRWELFVKGGVTSVDLPDFAALGEASPLPQGTAYIRLWRVYAPGLTVDAFSSKLLSSWAWVSWAYAVRSTDEPDLIGSPNYQPQMLPPAVPKPGFAPPQPPPPPPPK